MARFQDDRLVLDALAPHLAAGETVQHYAYGVKQPPVWLIFLLYVLGAVVPGAIAIALITKEYVVATTERRLLVLRFSGARIKVKQVLSWPLERLAGVRTAKGGLFTHIRLDDPAQPFEAKFHRLGMKDNQAHAEAMADVLEQAAAPRPAA